MPDYIFFLFCVFYLRLKNYASSFQYSIQIQVLELLVLVLSERETEERWRRWSRQIVDTILPMMANGRMHLESRDAHCALSRVFASIAPSVLRPVDQLLRTLFAAPPNLVIILAFIY